MLKPFNPFGTEMIRYEFVKNLPTEEVVELYKSGGWWEEIPHSREIIPLMISGSFCFLAVFHEKKLVGMGRAISDGVSDAYLQDIVVRKEYRGLYIGKEIVTRLVNFCVERKLEWIGLIAEAGLENYYKTLGFEKLIGSTAMVLKK